MTLFGAFLHRGTANPIVRKVSKDALGYIDSPPLSARAGRGSGRDRGGDHAHYDPDPRRFYEIALEQGSSNRAEAPAQAEGGLVDPGSASA